MKRVLFNLKALSFSLLIGALFISCQSEEPVINQPDMHERIMGQWEAEGWSPYNKKWTITEDSIYTTVHTNGETKHEFCLRYELVNDSTIYFVRCWVNKDEPHYAVKTKINFDDENTLTINDFSPTIAEVYPPRFVPITLKRK